MFFQLHHASSVQSEGQLGKSPTALPLKIFHGITTLVAATFIGLLAMARAHETGYGTGNSCSNCKIIEIPIEVSDPSIVNLKFYSSDRDWSWPGPDRNYIIDDYAEHTFPLRCQYGEQICYGAWKKDSPSETWGVGQSISNPCTNCCWTCYSERVRGKNLL